MTDLVTVSGLDTEPADAARFDAWARVLVDVARAAQGEDHDAWSVEELRGLEGSRTKRRRQVLAVDGGDPVGAAGLIAPLLDNTATAQVYVSVLPERRRRGIGDLVMRWAGEEARALRRTILQAETHWWADAFEDPFAGWVERHGFEPAQSVLRSDLDAGLPTGHARPAGAPGPTASVWPSSRSTCGRSRPSCRRCGR